MLFRFNQKTLLTSLLFAVAFGFLFLTHISSVSANHYAMYPFGVAVSSGNGVEHCNNKSECDTLCETRGMNPMACFYFYGDSGLAPQKAGYFKTIAIRARKALEILKVNGGPGGCRTSEACREFGKQLLADPASLAFRSEYQQFTIEGIHVDDGGPTGEVQLKIIIRMAEALEQAAREKIKPPSTCAYGLMCFGECSESYDSDSDTYGEPTPECKKYFEETGYDENKDIVLKDIVLEQLIQTSDSPGDCADLITCEVYCDAEEHRTECAEFADKNNLAVAVPDDQKDVLAAIQKGDAPGECKDEVSCRKYCGNTSNVGECAKFAEKFDLVTPDELKEMRQLAAAKEAGVPFPGNCKDKESCFAYCDNSARQVECMEFAQKAGFIPEEDAEGVSNIISYLKSGGKLPGGCTSKESCEAYCESDTHINECMDFAVGAGFVPPEVAEIMKKTGGKGPGNCRSREACDSYCKDETHVDECIDFAVKAGFISSEDAAMAKKFGISSGPGDCKSKAECQSFCTLPENQETCSNWAKEHGMDTGGLGGQAGPGGCKNQEECTAYCKDHQEECQKFAPPGGVGDRGGEECVKQGGSFDGTTCKFPEGQFPGIQCENPPCEPSEQPGDGQGGDQQQQGGGDSSGPGGCKTPDECKTYCEANPQACQGSGPPIENQDRGAEECSKQGGNLKDGQCYFNDPTQKDIGVDHGGEECVKQGGSWTGSSCNFPPPPTSSLLPFSSLLGTVLGPWLELLK